MKFEVVGSIQHVGTIATGPGVKVRSLLRKTYGRGRWRKMKGIEAHGFVKRDLKIEDYLDKP